MAEVPTLGSLSSRVVLGDLISAAIDGVRAGSLARPPSPHDLEREIYWRIERVLAAQDQRAAVLRTEIAEVLTETDALRSALASAIQTGNDRLRNDVISSAIETLSGALPRDGLPGPGWRSRGRADAATPGRARRRVPCAQRDGPPPVSRRADRPGGPGRDRAPPRPRGPRRGYGRQPRPALGLRMPLSRAAPVRPGACRGVLRPAAAHRRADRQAGGTPGRAEHGRRVRRIRCGQVVPAARGSAARR